MRTEQILNLDCRKEENQEIIQKVLRQIKPLSKCSEEYDIPFEKIEKAIVVMEKKYNMRVRDFVPDVWSNEKNAIWRATLIDDTNLKTIAIIYGLSVYEVFVKSAIAMYAEVRKGISERNK